jgi:hypothetical protein
MSVKICALGGCSSILLWSQHGGSSANSRPAWSEWDPISKKKKKKDKKTSALSSNVVHMQCVSAWVQAAGIRVEVLRPWESEKECFSLYSQEKGTFTMTSEASPSPYLRASEYHRESVMVVFTCSTGCCCFCSSSRWHVCPTAHEYHQRSWSLPSLVL